MFSAFEWMVASRYLRARRREGFISVIALFSLLGIALGVATLIIVMSVMNGFKQELMGRILGLNGHLTVYGPVDGLADFDALKDRLSTVAGVRIVTPMIENQVMATANSVARGAVVRAFRAEDLRKKAIIADNIIAGSLDAFQGEDAIVIGTRMAERMGVRVGDPVTLISPKGNVTAFGSVPRLKAYTVVAIYEIGMYEYDANFVFMPLEAAQTYFRMATTVSALEVFADSPEKATALVRPLAKAAGDLARVQDWQRTNASFFNAIQVERNVMFLILTLIIVVAAFNIISSLIMLVKDKGRDIAILRTMGATKGAVMRIFFLAGASIGVVGTTAGVILGLAFTSNIESIRQAIQSLTGTELFAAEIYFLSQLPAIVDPLEVVAVTAMAFTLTLLATLYPSWKAARIDPAEALRYE